MESSPSVRLLGARHLTALLSGSAGAVIFLASDVSAYITGQTLHVNGGLLMVD